MDNQAISTATCQVRSLEVDRAVLGPVVGKSQISINSCDEVQWDRIVAGMEDGSYDQTTVYAQGRWPGRTERCLVYNNDDILGGAIVVLLTAPMLKWGLAYVKFGPFWRPKGQFVSLDNYETVIHAIWQHYCCQRGHHLSILPRPNPEFMAAEMVTLRRLGFRSRGNEVDPYRYMVDVSLEPEELLAGLSQKWRYNLRKAQKNPVTVERHDDLSAVEVFVDLHRQMVERKKLDNIESTELLPKMLGSLPREIAPRIYLAKQESEPVAGAVVGCLGDTAYYVFGSSTGAALKTKAGFTLQWHIAESLMTEPSIKWYDLGGAAMDDRLPQFKRGLVGRTGVIVEMNGEFDHWKPGIGHFVARGLYGLRASKGWLEAYVRRI